MPCHFDLNESGLTQNAMADALERIQFDAFDQIEQFTVPRCHRLLRFLSLFSLLPLAGLGLQDRR